jgi:hypothetical protein
VDTTTDSPEFRVEIRHCVKPSNPYVWEIYSVTELKRSSQSFPTRGVAIQARKKALLRMIASPHGHLVAMPQRESGAFPKILSICALYGHLRNKPADARRGIPDRDEHCQAAKRGGRY